MRRVARFHISIRLYGKHYQEVSEDEKKGYIGLGVYGVLGCSFKTTNCLESVNALVEERCAKVDHWKNSSQGQRWLATALVDIEPPSKGEGLSSPF